MGTIRYLLMLLLVGSLLSPIPARSEYFRYRITPTPVETVSWFSLLLLQDLLSSGGLRKTLGKELQRYWLDHPAPEPCYVGFLKTAENKKTVAAAAAPPPLNPVFNHETPESLLPEHYALAEPPAEPLPPATATNLQLVVPDGHSTGVPQQLLIQVLQMLYFYPVFPLLSFSGVESTTAQHVSFRNNAPAPFHFRANNLIRQLFSTERQYIPCLVCNRQIRSIYLQRRQAGDSRTIVIDLTSPNRLSIRHYLNCSFGGHQYNGCQTSYVDRTPLFEDADQEIMPPACSCLEQHRRSSERKSDKNDDPPPPPGGSGLVN